MLHTEHKDGVDICEPQMQEPLDPRVAPRSLLLDSSSQFQAYEYDLSSRQPMLSSAFLRDLGDLLSDLGLETLLALESKPQLHSLPSTETMLIDGSGKVRGMRSDPDEDREGFKKAIPTGWTFRRSSEIEIMVSKKCVTLPTGLHEVRPN